MLSNGNTATVRALDALDDTGVPVANGRDRKPTPIARTRINPSATPHERDRPYRLLAGAMAPASVTVGVSSFSEGGTWSAIAADSTALTAGRFSARETEAISRYPRLRTPAM